MSAPDEATGSRGEVEAVLAAHVPLGDEDNGIEQCSCGVIAVWRRDDEDDVRYLDTHAEGPDLRWHIAHVAAVLAPVLAEVRAEALREAADAVWGISNTSAPSPTFRVTFAYWLRDRADRIGGQP
jgi:hypothetical protein